MKKFFILCAIICAIDVFSACSGDEEFDQKYQENAQLIMSDELQPELEDADSTRIIIRPITNEQVMDPQVSKDGKLEPIPVKEERKMVGRLYDSSKESGIHIDLAITYRTKDKMVHELAVIPCPNNTEGMKITVAGLGAELEQTHFDAKEEAFLGETSGTLVITYDNGKKAEEPFRVRFKMPL